jgi:hypothetical protein
MDEIKNAIIKSAKITSDDRGFLSVWLDLDYGGIGQGFGGWALYLPKSFKHHKQDGPAGHFIYRCMEIAGVTEWSEMKGRTIRVKSSFEKISALGHIVNEDWFCPSDDFEKESK